jgi:hypothetical protein
MPGAVERQREQCLAQSAQSPERNGGLCARWRPACDGSEACK